MTPSSANDRTCSALVIDAVGEDPFPRAGEGTHFAQPAIFAASLAGWHALGRPPGTSWPAIRSASSPRSWPPAALAEADGVRLVALRGRLMDASGREAGDGGMIAVLGADAAERAPEVALAHRLSIANDNSPQQVVLSGLAPRAARRRSSTPRISDCGRWSSTSPAPFTRR